MSLEAKAPQVRIRALSPEHFHPTAAAYADMFRSVRRLFAAPGAAALGRGQATARAIVASASACPRARRMDF